MSIKCIVIDDEPLAVELLAGYIRKTPFLDLKASFHNPFDAMDMLQREAIDLLFLDIEMPDLSGLELARTLAKGPELVLTTAYQKYALDAFKVNAIDYLLKPFSYEEFLKAAGKARDYIGLKHQGAAAPDDPGAFLFVKSEYRSVKILLDDILYIEGLKDYVKIVTRRQEQPLLTLASLKAIAAKLPAAGFMRVHRSFIVNLKRISAIERSRIVFGKVYIPVGEQYKAAFQAFVDKSAL